MACATIVSRAVVGVHAIAVNVEVHLSAGLPGFTLVGLPAKAVKESKDRVRSAILNCGLDFPVKRIVVNLAPADLPKEGGSFDLAIALGILIASKQLPSDCMHGFECAGELSLDGLLRSVHGVLPMAIAVFADDRQFIVSYDNADEARLVEGLVVAPMPDLLAVCQCLKGLTSWPDGACESAPPNLEINGSDMSEVREQPQAKRVLEIAAAGGHSVLMVGPPGSGKTLLASCLPGLLPPLSMAHAQETAAIYSVSQQGIQPMQWRVRPFRRPHHSASSVALVGGGNPPSPGEISLAHNGVLFLDELPEFSRSVLEALREPLESRVIHIARATQSVCFPCHFQLIAAMNPCPCGYYSDPDFECRCSMDQVMRYQGRLSGPFLDRLDLQLEVPRIPTRCLLQSQGQQSESSVQVRERVLQAQQRQITRSGSLNAQLSNAAVNEVCDLQSQQNQQVIDVINQLHLSARALYRIMKVARTIADLAAAHAVTETHWLEAIHYHRPVLGQSL